MLFHLFAKLPIRAVIGVRPTTLVRNKDARHNLHERAQVLACALDCVGVASAFVKIVAYMGCTTWMGECFYDII